LGEVFVRCPVTGQKIATGIDTDRHSLSLTPDFVGRVFCPHCKTEHEWTKATALIEGDDGNQTS
jgi:hypothetical protein